MSTPTPPFLSLPPHITSTSVYIPPPPSPPLSIHVSSPSSSSSSSSSQPQPPTSYPTYHIFFIPGNPGCIPYYHTFLTLLSQTLAEKNLPNTQFHVYAHSLANFCSGTGEDGNGNGNGNENRNGNGAGQILGLRQQIEYVGDVLDAYLQAHGLRSQGEGDVRVILVGHSVGAYIGMEILRAWNGRGGLVESLEGGIRDVEKREGEGGVRARWQGSRVVGLVGLWPTITWIGKSRSGKRLGWLTKIPFFALMVGTLVRCLTTLLSYGTMKTLVKYITSMPDDAAKTTTDFLRSPSGVQQSIYMARDEMNEITADRWNTDIWGDATPSSSESPRSKLAFYFGKDDHWVASHMRDELIAARGWRDEVDDDRRPRMEVDQEGVPHDFCIRHSATVARKTAMFVEDIVETDRASSLGTK